MTLTPGYGTEQLHLRDSSERLKRSFGAPTKRQRAGSYREYWLYPKGHFDCIVSRNSGSVLSLFLHPGNPLVGLCEFDRTEAELMREYGVPSQQGGGFHLATGEYVNRWLAYDQGIGFDFDSDHRLCTISIFAPKKKASRVRLEKSVASHRGPHLQQIAAMRA